MGALLPLAEVPGCATGGHGPAAQQRTPAPRLQTADCHAQCCHRRGGGEKRKPVFSDSDLPLDQQEFFVFSGFGGNHEIDKNKNPLTAWKFFITFSLGPHSYF